MPPPFAQNHRNWTIDDWPCIIWSDESKCELFRTSGRVWIGEQLQDDFVVQTVAQVGGSIMVWGCMMRNHIGHIALVNEQLNAEKYICILENALVPTIYEFELGHGDVTLMHDNAPTHGQRVSENGCSTMATALLVLGQLNHRMLIQLSTYGIILRVLFSSSCHGTRQSCGNA